MANIEIIGRPFFNIDDQTLDFIYHLFFKNVESIEKGGLGIPLFIIAFGDDRAVGQFAPRDQEHKESLKRKIFGLCRDKNADFVAFVVDTWMKKSNDPNQKIIRQDDTNRLEALAVFLNDRHGNSRTLVSFYQRFEGKVVFEESAEWKNESHYFTPMIQPWGGYTKQ